VGEKIVAEEGVGAAKKGKKCVLRCINRRCNQSKRAEEFRNEKTQQGQSHARIVQDYQRFARFSINVYNTKENHLSLKCWRKL
jgi:urease accessory protein UreF